MKPAPDHASHLMPYPGARRCMCGEFEPLPAVWWRWLPEHHAGHGLVAVPSCAAVFAAVLAVAVTGRPFAVVAPEPPPVPVEQVTLF